MVHRYFFSDDIKSISNDNIACIFGKPFSLGLRPEELNRRQTFCMIQKFDILVEVVFTRGSLLKRGK